MAKDPSPDLKKAVLVGNPNVGKSVIFRLLTGSYVMVSNFPGTTVEVSRGRMRIGDTVYEVIDTPGVNSLIPQSEDEWVACEILLREKPDVLIQVADAKNLRRTLLITSQLAELGIPMVLVLNMIDEAEDRGIRIDSEGIGKLFSIPVVETIAIYGKGKKGILNAVANAGKPRNALASRYPDDAVVRELDGAASPAFLSLEWLAEDNPDLTRTLAGHLGETAISRLKETQARLQTTGHGNAVQKIGELRKAMLDDATGRFKKKRRSRFADDISGFKRLWVGLLFLGLFLFAWNEFGGLLGVPTPFTMLRGAAETRLEAWLGARHPDGSFVRTVLLGEKSEGGYRFGLVAEAIHILLLIAPVLVPLSVLISRSRGFAFELGILTRRALTGIPILIGVMLMLYEFVGYTGAQTLVGLIEKSLFGQFVTPWLKALIPAGFVADFLVGKYGILSMGLTYALGIVLPVVGTFFIAFGLLEDSGYLPRLSVLADRVMRWMGLNGKAVLPMVLGFGCGTMAVMATRILSSKKERTIAVLLLALGIPCSAQLGVMLGIAAGVSLKATLTIFAVVLSQLLLVGFLAARVIRGNPSEFIFEIPPIRMPQFKNVAFKTWYRIQWYLKEAVPLFLIGTFILFVLDKVHVHGRSLLLWVQAAVEPVISGLLHLPVETAGIFLLGFLRRDYGAAGFYDLTRQGLLTGQQVVVSMIVITLFVPCVASFLMIIKEQGLKKALAITGFIVPFAVFVGTVVSWILRTLDIQFR